MPGETPETIEETGKFTAFFAEQSPRTDPNALSINFAQALPGTPLYEIARHKGDIKTSLEGEENYLITISDRDARDGETYLNFTEYPRLLLEKWHFDIQSKTRQAYINKWGMDSYYKIIFSSPRFKDLSGANEQHHIKDSGYFADPARQNEIPIKITSLPRPQASSDSTDSTHDIEEEVRLDKGKIPSLGSLLRKKSIGSLATFYPHFFWRLKAFAILFIFGNCVRKYGFKFSMILIFEYLEWRMKVKFKNKGQYFLKEYISLRKILRKKIFPNIEGENPGMTVLRKGR